MCNFLSAIVIKPKPGDSPEVYCDPEHTDSHEDLIANRGLADNGRGGFVRVELTLSSLDYADLEAYTLRIDCLHRPEWFDEQAGARVEHILRGCIKRMLVDDQRDMLLGGCWILHNAAHIKRVHNARIVAMQDSARIGEVRGVAWIDRMLDSARIERMLDSTRIGAMWDSARVDRMLGSARVDRMLHLAQVGEMWGSARVREMLDSARIGEMWDSTRIDRMRDLTRIDRMLDSARVVAMHNSARIANYRPWRG